MLRHLSADENKRVQALDELQIFNSTQDEILDKITSLTCQLLDMPTSLITLISSNKQTIKAKQHFHLDETEREDAFCKYTIQAKEVVVCHDTATDSRFSQNPLAAGTTHIRFYAGAPLVTTEGYAIGGLCVLDTKPREFSAEQQNQLRDMAAVLMSLIESRNAIGFVDAVTHLPNRQRLIEDLSQMVDINQGYALILIDSIDITYAYEMGRSLGMPTVEKVLREVGTFLRVTFHDLEKIYCVATGRFALLVKTERKEHVLNDLARCAGQIQDSLSSHLPIKLEMYIGYSEFSAPGRDPQRLLREAMSALHDAISLNVRVRSYSEDSDRTRKLAFTLLSDLGDCLHHGVDLYLVYQPKLNVKTGDVVGVEALIRWKHPDLGEISPAEFIPLAENTTLITPLTEWVIVQTLRQIKIWRAAGILIPVSVNVSASNFAEFEFVERLQKHLNDHGLTSTDIELECLETQKILGSPDALACLHNLKRQGFTLALDDFGSGYSNLSYLKKIPAEVIKLDQSLIRDLTEQKDSQVIVEQVIAMLHKLDFLVIAEGVEDRETLHFLERYGCDEVQGYYFSRPLMPEVLVSWLVGREESAV
ncbi:sensor domain-containing phosphodiesterase [Edaphovirga cremea]|uniref:sensor domain-containing phosphodiesterase n=1 Tax=Edaphovirga cremea TaxID=2267246 RepID=UPI000DEEFD53|nr:sensor domain-containing phosphodiesterase [Edaphovirga cremea]